jgi:8-oxo-dGTP pyrophosphatase MutT (NUDIX family)
MWNGFGGKVEPSDESIASAAAREILEECHLQVHTKDLEKRGILTFSFVGSEEILQVNIFVTKKFEGNPLESDEMLSPQWFYLHQLPFNQMWSDDQYWLPHVMNGKKVYGHFHFDQDQATILDYDLDIIPTATV